MTTFGYDDAAHRYTLNGQTVPSATQVVGLLDKPFLAPGAVKATAAHVRSNLAAVVADFEENPYQAERNLKGAYKKVWNAKRDLGSLIHEAIESFVTTGSAIGLPDAARPYFAAFLDFVKDHDPVWLDYEGTLQVEQCVFSERHRYAGKFDAMAEVMGARLLIDFKTGSNVNPVDVALQLSAYRYADFVGDLASGESRPLLPVDGAAILHLRPGKDRKGRYELWEVEADEAVWESFLALRGLYDFVRREDELKLGTLAKTQQEAA